jgi:magnesium chelatase family protein
MKTRHIRTFCTLSQESSLLLKQAINRFALSARSYFKIIKVSQTIADMDDKKVIETAHVAEALQLRTYEEN